MRSSSKFCPRCAEEKSLDDFYRNASRKDGYQTLCKPCHNVYTNQSERGRAAKLSWSKTDKGKANYARYKKTEGGKASEARYRETEGRKSALARYNATDKRRAVTARYNRSPNGRVNKVAHLVRRRIRELQATPAWANLEAIKELYADAARLTTETGIVHHVDHRVPLRSKLVSGLHVHYNLRVMPGVENIRKGNREWPDMPG